MFATLGAHCKAVSGNLPVLISPYIDGKKNHSEFADKQVDGPITTEALEREWNQIFEGIKGAVDIVAFQDGHVDYDELVDFLKINKRLCDMPIRFLPIKWDKLKLKLDLAAQAGIENAITFEFSHFMSPQSMYPSAGHLYNRYKEYLDAH
jgi:hypothetical protein